MLLASVLLAFKQWDTYHFFLPLNLPPTSESSAESNVRKLSDYKCVAACRNLGQRQTACGGFMNPSYVGQ
jgi:hypothetical protein